MSDESLKGHIGNAVILACLAGIILVAALIVFSPRKKEGFTQLWLKAWKLNLTNLTEGDPILDALATEAATGSILASSVLGNRFYVDRSSLRVGFEDDLLTSAPRPTFIGAFARTFSAGDTIWLGANALYLDSVDAENDQILFWEYPRVLDSRRVRFAFVIENNLGEDHEYRVNVSFNVSYGAGNASMKVQKAWLKVRVRQGEQKTCVVDFFLTSEEVTPILGPAGQNARITAQVDTREEVFFWISRW